VGRPLSYCPNLLEGYEAFDRIGKSKQTKILVKTGIEKYQLQVLSIS